MSKKVELLVDTDQGQWSFTRLPAKQAVATQCCVCLTQQTLVTPELFEVRDANWQVAFRDVVALLVCARHMEVYLDVTLLIGKEKGADAP